MDLLAKYGIKEVADVVFYALGADGKPTHPVLYLDTLKVSTIEQTAEQTEARGGKGNPPLIIWDYNKEITVTLEDALFSAKSMAIMFGNGSVSDYTTAEESGSETSASNLVMRTLQYTYNGTAQSTWVDPQGKTHTMVNPKYYDENGNILYLGTTNTTKLYTAGTTQSTTNELATGKAYFVSFDIAVEGAVIEISANSFPGTYYITGDTYARKQVNGADEFFQFIIPKAKVSSENTITLEAEGDPSVFSMNLRVLRPEDGIMMKLVKYELKDEGTSADSDVNMYHNHILNAPATEDDDG